MKKNTKIIISIVALLGALVMFGPGGFVFTSIVLILMMA